MKRIVLSLCLFALLYATGFQQTFAINYPKVSCSNYGSNANGCNECFDGGGKYVGDVFQPNDTFNAGSQDRVYFQKRNGTVVRFNTLNSKTSWFKSDNLLRYTPGFVWYTASNGDRYHLFRANTSERFLETVPGRGIRLQSVADDTVNPYQPAFKLTFTAKYQTLLSPGNLAAERTHNECVFFEPRYCGDGILQTDKGETCDPRDPNRIGHGNGGCDTNTCQPITINPVCNSLTVDRTTGTAPTNVVATCSGFNVDRFEINCGNGQVFIGNGNNSGNETFTRTCNYTSGGSFTPTCRINGSITSNSCQKHVTISNPTPSILVDKLDGNPSDLDGDVGNDEQKVRNGEIAIFRIRVTNNGNQEALRNITLTDTRAPACATQAGGFVNLSAKRFINRNNENVPIIFGGSGNHNNNILAVGEYFEYTCSEPNTTSDYTNIVSTSGVGVTSNATRTSSDDTQVLLVGDPAISINKTDENPNDLDNIVDQQTVGVGDPATFRITIRNSGSEDLRDVRLNDPNSISCGTFGNSIVDLSAREFIDGNGDLRVISVSGAGNHNDDIFQVGEVFTYTCSQPNTQLSYTNVVDVEGTGVDTNIVVVADNDTEVILDTDPAISIDKTDANPDDRDGVQFNNTQTVLRGSGAVFQITVTNTGNEDLRNIILSDPNAVACSTNGSSTVDLTNSQFTDGNGDLRVISVSGAGNHNDDIFQVGEVFTYTCSQPNTQNDYINRVDVNGTGVISGDDVTANDTTPIIVEDLVYDLALVKILSNTTPGPFIPGSLVTFDIIVVNQGDINANNIEVTDYVPSGLTLTGGSTAVQTIPSIPAGGTGTLSVSFIVDATASGSISNFAEISADDGDDCDSTPDNINGNQNGETTGSGLIDNSIGNGCNPGGDEDDHDIETITINPAPVYDLALIKTLSNSTPGPFKIGDVVTFDIQVFNQGDLDSGVIRIRDHAPEGLTLNDPNWTLTVIVGDGPGGPIQINEIFRDIPNIPAGSGATFPISFIVDSTASGSLINVAEISLDSGDDCDSIPDNVDGNQTGETLATGMVNDETGGQCVPGGDEDDHDFEEISVDIYDLALIKTYNGSGSVNPGDVVTFNIEVRNQGSLDANNIEITDYIPTGLTLTGSTWTQSGSLATQVIPSLLAGSGTTLDISFVVDTNASGIIENTAEISADDGDDCDSTPNQIINDDITINTNTFIPGCVTGTDEDDHDVESITIGIYDLALRKTRVGSGTLSNGQIVTFNIEVFNQGDVDSGPITVTDYIPTGLTLTGSTWNQSGSLATQNVSNIAALGSVVLPISFVVTANGNTTISNFAEISADSGNDCDSTPDQDNTNDALTDNEIGVQCDTNPDDEDDHDAESINVQNSGGGNDYDLALRKTLNATGSTSNTGSFFSTGGTVVFDIEVFNQGDITANDIEVTDYIPTGLTLTGSTWTQSGSLATQTLSGSIAPGTSRIISIEFSIDATATGTIDNYAEISVDDGQDCDSTPDQVNGNDALIDDEIGSRCDTNPDDEDDHDIAEIIVGEAPILPTIEVLKYSANQNDTDGNTDDSNDTNDSQRFARGGTAVFRIVVSNNGPEDLQNVSLVDAQAPTCDRTDAQTQVLIQAVGNNDSILNIGESFSYDCSDPNITANYTNSITVNAIGVNSTLPSTDTDTTSVVVTGGPGGGSSAICTEIRVTDKQVTCRGTRANSFRVDCDTTDSSDGFIYTTNVVLVNGRFEGVLTCPNTPVEPRCYASKSPTGGPLTQESSWKTSDICKIDGGGGGNPRCGDGILGNTAGEQCEAFPNDQGVLEFPAGCSNTCRLGGGGGGDPEFGIRTVPSQTGIRTYPIGGGELIFDIRADDVVIGDGMSVTRAISETPRLTNNSIYDIAISDLCLVKKSGFSLTPGQALGPNFYNGENVNGYCQNLGDRIMYPGEKITLDELAYSFTGTTAGFGDSKTFEDNQIWFTMKSDGKVYNDAYFSPVVTVRVAKPTVATTGGTTFFEDSFIANLSDVSKDITDDATNFGGVVIGDDDNLGDNGTVTGDAAKDAAKQDGVNQIEYLSSPRSTLGDYNGNENIQIIHGTDLRASTDLPDSIDEATTFIVENANLIIDKDIEYAHNVGFIVRGGNIIVSDNVTTMDGSYVAIPKDSNTGKINGTVKTQNRLVVNGSLYGDSKDLISKRTYIKSADDKSGIRVGTIVSFGASFFRDPAPLLGKFIGEYTDSQKVAK